MLTISYSCVVYCTCARSKNWQGLKVISLNVSLEILQGEGMENPMNGGAWCTAVHVVTRSRTRLSDFTFTFHYHALEKAMAPDFSTLAWRIPWMEEPGRLQSMGSRRVRYNWATSLSLFTFMHWRRKWQPTPVFFPGESQEWGSLVGCRLWGRTESDTTDAT